MLAIGLMSGTSLDGVDAALVEIVDGKVYLKKFITLDYDNEFKKRLMKNLNDSTAKLSEICSLNFEPITILVLWQAMVKRYGTIQNKREN